MRLCQILQLLRVICMVGIVPHREICEFMLRDLEYFGANMKCCVVIAEHNRITEYSQNVQKKLQAEFISAML